MSYPITPNPSIHSLPANIAKQQSLAESQAIQASAKNMVEGLINAILWHLSGGLLGHNPNTQTTVTSSTKASGFLAAFWNKAVVNAIDSSRIPTIPSSHIAYTTPNILIGGDFPNANSVATGTGFVWDSTTDHTGTAGSGSALAVANGLLLTLASPLVAVAQNDQLTASGWVEWSGVTATTGTALQISVVSYDSSGNLISNTAVATLPSSGVLAASGSWQQMTGSNYSVPAGVAQVSVQVSVSSVVSAGNVWFDDLSLIKTGPIGGDLVSGLTGIGSTIRSDLQASLNAIGQAIFGGLGNHSPATINAAMLQIPQENIVIQPNPSSTGVTFDANGSSWTTSNTGGYAGTATITGSHTVGTGNLVVVGVSFSSTNSSSRVSRSVTYGASTMGIFGSSSRALSGGGNTTTELYGLFNPPSGAQTVTVTATDNTFGISSLIGWSTSYNGVTGIGRIVTNTGANSSPSLTATSLTTVGMFAQVFAAQNSAVSGTETLGSYNRTSRFNSGNVTSYPYGGMVMVQGDAATAASVSFSATASPSSTNTWVGVSVELESNVGFLGSGFRASYNSTSAVSISSGQNLAPGSYYSTGYTGNTSDYSYSTATNKLTVSQAGWYAVKISYALNSGLVLGYAIQPILYQNGAATQFGQSLMYPAGTGYNLSAADTFFVYLNAGDYLQPGYSASAARTNALTGDTSGVTSYWSVTLCNRSLM